MVALQSRKLADYIQNLPDFTWQFCERSPYYNHVGATYTDVVLQAGLNYTSVVKPRVLNVLTQYSQANTVMLFDLLIKEKGLNTIISWNNAVKLNRFNALMEFSKAHGIDTCSDLRYFFAKRSNQEALLQLNGFGNKTVDYFLKLLGFDTVAVDRHVYSFLESAQLPIEDYHQVKQIVEYAADFLYVSRASLDLSIWTYMSRKASPPTLFSEKHFAVAVSNS